MRHARRGEARIHVLGMHGVSGMQGHEADGRQTVPIPSQQLEISAVRYRSMDGFSKTMVVAVAAVMVLAVAIPIIYVAE